MAISLNAFVTGLFFGMVLFYFLKVKVINTIHETALVDQTDHGTSLRCFRPTFYSQ